VKKSRLIVLLVAFSSIAIALKGPADRYFEIAKNLDIFATLFKEVNAYYVDEVDPDKLIRSGIDSMLATLDPYTNYIPEDEIESFRSMTTGQYAGIGAMIGKIEEKVVITMAYEGFAADKSGLRIGDQLLSIDAKPVDNLSVSEISDLLKGQVNTEVQVEINRINEKDPLLINITRERIKLTNIPYSGIVEDQIGYIKLEDFTTNAGEEVAAALKELKNMGAKKIILDLRSNPGGLLSEAVNVSNIFIPKKKEVVSTKGKVQEWNKTYKTLNEPEDTQIPLVVMANGGSASAAEIVSGVIQDYDRGILVGDKTFGKGLVQTTRPLSYNSQLKVTTAKYYIPSGRCIQALDYSNRDEDGSVYKVADSLKNQYKTTSGRIVYDGEGLSPDINIQYLKLAPITITLVRRGLIFEYATKYVSENPLSDSVEDFKLSDDEYDEFKLWLKDKEYDYTTQVEKNVEDLVESARVEKYYQDIENSLEQLKERIFHNKEKDLNTFKSEITRQLEQEILSRKYYQAGAIKAGLKDDPQLLKAVEILKDELHYNKILQIN